MDNLAFKIQLGVILPKLDETISKQTLDIFDELVGFVQSGEVDGQNINVEEIKEILVKDFEIFLDKKIIPKSQKLKTKEITEETTEKTEEE